MLLAATVLIITVTIILIRHGRRTEEERPRPPQIEQVQPRRVESEPPTPPPTEPQETPITWVTELGKKKKTTQTSSSNT